MSENKKCPFCGGRRIGGGRWSGYAAMYPVGSSWRSSAVLTEVCCDCGQVLSIREKEYIEAARALGAKPWRIMFVDILPNLLAPLIVYATLLIPLNIVAEAALSFLGVGIQDPTPDWGKMISDSSQLFQYGYWWYLLFPSLALLITTLAFNILGDSVRDALDPRGGGLYK